MTNNIFIHRNDLSEKVLENISDVAIDTETTGLNFIRDRLCVLQLSFGNKEAHIVQFDNNYDFRQSKHLISLLNNDSIMKVFHYARFDMAQIKKNFGFHVNNVYCTKIASKLARTYTDSHGLKELCRELLSITISKQQQSSYWGKLELTKDQLEYASSDVLYLHDIRDKLNEILVRENRIDLLRSCLKYLQVRVDLDLEGWTDIDIFAH